MDSPLAHHLIGYLMQPSRMPGYRLSYRPSGNKTDPDDALIIAVVPCRDRDQLPTINPTNTTVQTLMTPLTDRARFDRDQTRLITRLNAFLRQHHPDALILLRDAAGIAALASPTDPSAAHRLNRTQVSRPWPTITAPRPSGRSG